MGVRGGDTLIASNNSISDTSTVSTGQFLAEKFAFMQESRRCTALYCYVHNNVNVHNVVI